MVGKIDDSKKKFKCEHCGKMCANPSALKMHIKYKHASGVLTGPGVEAPAVKKVKPQVDSTVVKEKPAEIFREDRTAPSEQDENESEWFF